MEPKYPYIVDEQELAGVEGVVSAVVLSFLQEATEASNRAVMDSMSSDFIVLMFGY